MSNAGRGKRKVAEETKMLCRFYRTEGRAPSKRKADPGDEATALECRLFHWLRDLRQRETTAVNSVQVAYLRRHAPQLLSQRPIDMKLLRNAHMCVAWVQAGRPTTHPEAQRFADFLRNRKAELSRGTRNLGDDICRVLCEGIPGWADTIKDAKSGHEGADADSGDVVHDDTCESMDIEVPPADCIMPSEQVSRVASAPTLLASQVPMDASDEMEVDTLPRPAMFPAKFPARGRGRTTSRHAAVHYQAAACAASLSGDAEGEDEDWSYPVSFGVPVTKMVWKNEEQRRAVERHVIESRDVDRTDGTVFVSALAVLRRGGPAKKTGQADEKGEAREKDEEDEDVVLDWEGGVLGVRCMVNPEGMVNTPELQLSGVSIERGQDTHGHYQVALSYLKAMWNVFTEVLGVKARHNPFIPGQTIFIDLGTGRTQTTGSSATAAAFLALLARFTECKFRRACAVTGQLTLNGRLFPVDSVEDKLQMAKEGGIKRVVVEITNYSALPARWKADPDLEVKCATDVFELINFCLEDGQGPLVVRRPWDPRLGILKRTCWFGGDDIRDMECAVMPGSGRLIITGLEQPDLLDGEEMSASSRAKGATSSALMRAMQWLSAQQNTEWFQRLPEGPRRYDIKRGVLIYGKEKGRTGKVRRREESADMHIHFPLGTGSYLHGLAICVALAESMRGCRTKLTALYVGGVEGCGSLVELHAQEETIKRDDFDVVIVPELPGQQNLGFPRSVPQGKQVVGFSHARQVLEYIFQDDLLVRPPATE